MSIASNVDLIDTFFSEKSIHKKQINDSTKENNLITKKKNKASSVTQRFLNKIKEEPKDEETYEPKKKFNAPHKKSIWESSTPYISKKKDVKTFSEQVNEENTYSNNQHENTTQVSNANHKKRKKKSPETGLTNSTQRNKKRVKKNANNSVIKKEKKSTRNKIKTISNPYYPSSPSSSSSWASMNVSDKSSSLKTYVNRYGKNVVQRDLKCIRKEASQSINKLETLIESLYNHMDILSFVSNSNEKQSIMNSTQHLSAIKSMIKDIQYIRQDIMPVLSSFIKHDVKYIREIEEDIQGFIYEVCEQCDDTIYGNPPPAPEEYICTSIFPVYQNSKNSGRRKSNNSNRIPPRSIRSVNISSSILNKGSSSMVFSHSTGIKGVETLNKRGPGDRRRRSIGMCPVKSEFCRNLENLMM